MNKLDLRRVLFKALLLYFISIIVFSIPGFPSLGEISAYNHLFPGRPRLPFGENPAQSYNLSLYDLDAMFASHEIAAGTKPPGEFRVLVIGDSSVWGTLLRPEETLPAQLNAIAPQLCGKAARFYNLGYPTISVTKDLLLIDYARRYQPDAILWLITLDALPRDRQLASPLVSNNAVAVASLIERYNLSLDAADLKQPTFWDQTLIGRRRALADLLRLQFYGVPWAATGIDQAYPVSFSPAQTDFEADDSFHNLRPPLDPAALAYDVLDAGIQASPAPILLVNEPMLISAGANSDIRYNFFYPRWAYDAYREQMSSRAAYLDLWDLLPPTEFTNSAIHLTPAGETRLAQAILPQLEGIKCP